jgi:serine/threonine protein phosphatase PrpC
LQPGWSPAAHPAGYLHTVLSPAAIQNRLTTQAEPDSAVAELIALVRTAGASDNVACVVADVTPTASSC